MNVVEAEGVERLDDEIDDLIADIRVEFVPQEGKRQMEINRSILAKDPDRS
jgi:hypothetical protein